MLGAWAPEKTAGCSGQGIPRIRRRGGEWARAERPGQVPPPYPPRGAARRPHMRVTRGESGQEFSPRALSRHPILWHELFGLPRMPPQVFAILVGKLRLARFFVDLELRRGPISPLRAVDREPPAPPIYGVAEEPQEDPHRSGDPADGVGENHRDQNAKDADQAQDAHDRQL